MTKAISRSSRSSRSCGRIQSLWLDISVVAEKHPFLWVLDEKCHGLHLGGLTRFFKLRPEDFMTAVSYNLPGFVAMVGPPGGKPDTKIKVVMFWGWFVALDLQSG